MVISQAKDIESQSNMDEAKPGLDEVKSDQSKSKEVDLDKSKDMDKFKTPKKDMDKPKTDPEKGPLDKPHTHRLVPSVRFLMFILAFLGGTVLGGGFAAFNFALVCMVNETAITPISDHIANQSMKDQCGGNLEDDFSASKGYNGEFGWDKTTQASLIAAYSIGAILPNIPSGILADRYGSKIIFAVSILINGLASAIVPTAAYMGANWLFAARVLTGLGNGMSWPSILVMVSRWGTSEDAGSLIGLGASGYAFGPLLAMVSSSMLCDSSLGWPSIFYLWAIIAVVFLLIWIIVYTDDPTRCRFISKDELEYIEKNKLRRRAAKESFWKLPWMKLLFSPGAMAIYGAQFCVSWSNFYISEYMPSYSKEVLYFDVRSNGITAALPALCQVIGRLTIGPMADKIKFGGRSKTFSIKFFTFTCTFIPSLCWLVVAFLDCRHATLAVAMFASASALQAGSSAGYLRGGILMAAQYSGVIGSLGNIGTYLAGVLMPYINGALIKYATVDEWRNTLFVMMAVLIGGGLQYQFMATAKQQDWARKKSIIQVHPTDMHKISIIHM